MIMMMYHDDDDHHHHGKIIYSIPMSNINMCHSIMIISIIMRIYM